MSTLAVRCQNRIFLVFQIPFHFFDGGSISSRLNHFNPINKKMVCNIPFA